MDGTAKTPSPSNSVEHPALRALVRLLAISAIRNLAAPDAGDPKAQPENSNDQP
jgi:hypothetical protein